MSALRAARLLDVKNGKWVEHPTILVSEGKVQAVGADVVVPPNAAVIDLKDLTLLPGLIDVHTHLLHQTEPQHGGEEDALFWTVSHESTAKRALLGAALAREDLLVGITTVRDLGNAGMNGDVALRDAIKAGWVVGPRMLVATRALSPVGGQFGRLPADSQRLIDQEYAVVSGKDDARRAVRQAVFDGADCLKVIVDSGGRILSVEELTAIVEEAHRSNRKVAAHAADREAIQTALAAGVDSIEHGYSAEEDQLRQMAQRKIFLVPTDYPFEAYRLLLAGLPNLSEGRRHQAEERMKAFAEANRKRLAQAFALGVRLAAGSDAYWKLPGLSRGSESLQYLRAYTQAGIPPLEIVRAATLHAADLLGWTGKVGCLHQGCFADVIGVRADPLSDISELERVVFVMKGGEVVLPLAR